MIYAVVVAPRLSMNFLNDAWQMLKYTPYTFLWGKDSSYTAFKGIHDPKQSHCEQQADTDPL